MKYVGVDLHKKSISVCAGVIVRGKREVLRRGRFACSDTAGIHQWCRRHDSGQSHRPFRAGTALAARFPGLRPGLVETTLRVGRRDPSRFQVSFKFPGNVKADRLETLALDSELKGRFCQPRPKAWEGSRYGTERQRGCQMAGTLMVLQLSPVRLCCGRNHQFHVDGTAG